MYVKPFFNCGQGIVDIMTANGDVPAGPSVFTRYDPATMLKRVTGSLILEECWGRKGLYRADNFQGDWNASGPFGGE
jgi:hypothetical protein